MQRIEIFRTGTHTAMSGERIAFGEAELQAAAAAYDPALHEAPIVVGHPESDAPAYGWVAGLQFGGGALAATPRQVDEAFAEMVKAGRFKKVSAAFYRPDAPGNPKPGGWYLRHVGFLGAQPPAVKGLKPVEFAGGAEGVVEFSDAWTMGVVARLFRNLREFMIAQFGQERAEQVVPTWDVDALASQVAQDQVREADAAPTRLFSETPDRKEPPVADTTHELAERERALAQREAAFAEREAAIAAREVEGRRAENAALLDRLVAEGRLLPALREEAAAFMDRLDASGAVEFGEGRSLTPLVAFRELLAKLPRAVDLRPLPEGEAALDAADPRAIAAAAVAFQEAEAKAGRVVTYPAAVRRVTEEAAR